MTRRCASRNCLVCVSKNPVAGDSRLRGARDTGGGGTASHADCGRGRSFEKSSLPGPRWGTAWDQRAGHRRHSVHRVVSRTAPAGYGQHDLAWGAEEESLDPGPCQSRFLRFIRARIHSASAFSLKFPAAKSRIVLTALASSTSKSKPFNSRKSPIARNPARLFPSLNGCPRTSPNP